MRRKILTIVALLVGLTMLSIGLTINQWSAINSWFAAMHA
jgi:hypothetical protein